MHTASEFNISVKLYIHCFLAFLYYDLHLLCSRLAASVHTIMLELSVPLSTAFFSLTDQCKHFAVSVRVGDVLEIEFN